MDSINRAVMRVGRNENYGVIASHVMMKVGRNENYGVSYMVVSHVITPHCGDMS